jgi:hypothetical protein
MNGMEFDQYAAGAERVAELEEALRKAVAHLRAMPLSPATYHAANAAEQVLNKEARHAPPPCFEAILHMIAGAPLIMAKLEGDQLTLRSPDPGTMTEHHRKSHAAALRDALVRGTTVTLKPR